MLYCPCDHSDITVGWHRKMLYCSSGHSDITVDWQRQLLDNVILTLWSFRYHYWLVRTITRQCYIVIVVIQLLLLSSMDNYLAMIAPAVIQTLLLAGTDNYLAMLCCPRGHSDITIDWQRQ